MDLDQHIQQLMRGELLSEAAIKGLTEKLKEQLVYQSNIEHLKAPLTVVGDLFGLAFNFVENKFQYAET